MKASKGIINFNKQIFIGWIGALVGAQIFSHAASEIFRSSIGISFAAIVGSILGSSLWMFSRAHDMKREGIFSFKKLLEDLLYFTPVNFLFSCIFYYPVLFFLSQSLLMDNFLNHFAVFSAVFIAQVIAFGLSTIALNIYRRILFRKTGKKL
jgi:uncharacterized membrane protein YeaQ/YmgE (transglycosylase-associated protein family)